MYAQYKAKEPTLLDSGSNECIRNNREFALDVGTTLSHFTEERQIKWNENIEAAEMKSAWCTLHIHRVHERSDAVPS